MIKKEKLPQAKLSELSPQRAFLNRLSLVTHGLKNLENGYPAIEQTEFENFKSKLTQEVELERLASCEQELIYGILDLFALKHKVGCREILFKELNKEHSGKMIGFVGPLGIAKTTIAKSLANDLEVEQATVEPYDQNPFWKASQEEPEKYLEFMLRSQIFFLISNISADIKTRLDSKINISDTSTLADILMWVEWYRATGQFDDKEYQTYQELVDLLKPIIPKPDLIVALKPDSVDNLKEGVEKRAQADPSRSGELIFTTEDNPDLAMQVELIDQIVENLIKQWQIPVLKFDEIDPQATYENFEVRYGIIYQIREKLGLLKDFLSPQPEEIARKVLHLMSSSDEKQIIVIHSKSMFSGKTTAECMIAKTLEEKNVLVFQPKAALRSHEKGFEDQRINVISRDGLKLKAETIENNNLNAIEKYIKDKNIDPKEKPYIFIDEVMLFVADCESPKGVVKVLEDLRRMGFHLILDGIDYTFQGEPFTFMFELLKETKNNSNWHEIRTSTKCRYCKKEAGGTRRLIINPDGTKTIADYNDTAFEAGNSIYEPVCCEKHKSCINQPEDFQREELPV